jgi:hypothetical protein
MRPSKETRKDRVKEGVAKSVNEINPEYKSHDKFAPPQPVWSNDLSQYSTN